MLILGWLIIGVAAAVAVGSFVKRNGMGTPLGWNIGAGVIGGFLGGYVSTLFSQMILGPGTEIIGSLAGAAIVGAIFALLVKTIKS